MQFLSETLNASLSLMNVVRCAAVVQTWMRACLREQRCLSCMLGITARCCCCCRCVLSRSICLLSVDRWTCRPAARRGVAAALRHVWQPPVSMQSRDRHDSWLGYDV